VITNYNFLINQILDLYNSNKNAFDFHQRAHNVLKQLKSPIIISKIFERNLSNSEFTNRNWLNDEIPYLTIFKNNNIEIKINIFAPAIRSNSDNAAYLIHHHGNSILSSFIFHGPGYRALEFYKNIIRKNDDSYILKIKKDFFHSKGNINVTDSWTPHVISEVKDLTASIVLWSEDNTILDIKSKSYFEKERTNYYIKDKKVCGIKDSEFVKKSSLLFPNNNFFHVKAITYFMNEISYKNDEFIDEKLNDGNCPEEWKIELTNLKNNTISVPHYTNTNTLNKNLKIKDITRALKTKRFRYF